MPTNEEFFRYHDFALWLNESETLSSGEVKAYEKDSGIDVSSTIISDVSVYSSTKIKYKLKAGDAEKIYILKIRAISSNGQKFEDWLEFAVK